MFKPISFFKIAAVALPVFSILFASGCGTQTVHPNEISSFDGTTYDSMLLAHGALTSLQSNVVTSYPKYGPIFNQAAAAYNVAFAAYSSFRVTPSTQTEVNVTIGNLTVAIVAIENAFQMDMQASTRNVSRIRTQAKHIRKNAMQSGISVSDIMTELEIAAAIAQTIPQSGPYARLAALVMQTTSAAMAAESSAAGQPINMNLIQPIPALP